MRTRGRFVAKLILATMAGVICLPVVIAQAHQSPGSCNSNNLDLTLTKNKTIVRPGEVVTYSVFVRNEDSGPSLACDITNADTTVTLPAADGTPTGSVVTVASGQNYPAGTGNTFLGTVDYTVAVGPGVTDVVARGDIEGTLHDAPVDHTASISKTVGTSITQPHLSLVKSADPGIGHVNTVITYYYEVINDSTANAPMANVTLTDDQCAPITLQSGDGNTNNILDMGETWQFMCKKTFSTPGTFTNNALVTAVNTADSRAVTSDVAAAAVTIRSLPGLPNAGGGNESQPDLLSFFSADRHLHRVR